MIIKRLALLLIFSASVFSQVTAPFSRGVNLSNWFQEESAQEIHFTKYTFEDFQDIQSLGVDVIRLPIAFHDMTSGSPDYTVDPLLFFFLDEIVSWVEVLGLHLIIDNHSFSPTGQTEPSVYGTLVAIWPQIAQRYLDSEALLYFEVLNEPTGISDLVWNTIQPNVVAAIRAVDSDRTVIVGPASWNSYNNLDDMPVYSDNNLIYTFHFYDPFIFTHQGASWTDPSMEPLSGVPFPYGASPMPSVPTELAGTWIHDNMLGYANEGTVQAIREKLDIALAFRDDRNVPIYCGEFGVLAFNADLTQRVTWYDELVHYLDSTEVAWTMWDYHGGFGLFEANSYGTFDHDLNIPLVEAMGFDAPTQTPFAIIPDSSNLEIYEDYVLAGITGDSETEGSLNMYSSINPRHGNYCMAWANANQYNNLSFHFEYPRDLNYLIESEYLLTLWIRPSGTPKTLDIRFVDSHTAIPEDHAWRMSASINANALEWNGEWQYVQIPLGDMVEAGAYDNGSYYPPQGLFDWGSIQILQLVAEQNDLIGTEFAFDAIKIVDQTAASTLADNRPHRAVLDQNYPNPFNAGTIIPVSLLNDQELSITIFDIQGRQVRTLANGRFNSGTHQLTWNGLDDNGQAVGSGVFLVQLNNGANSELIKATLLR